MIVIIPHRQKRKIDVYENLHRLPWRPQNKRNDLEFSWSIVKMDARLLVAIFAFCLFGQCQGHGEFFLNTTCCFNRLVMCLFYRGDVFSQPLVVYLRVHWKYEPRGLRVSLWDPQWLQGLRPWSRKWQICRLLAIRRTPWLVYKLYKSWKKDNWRQVCNLWVFQEITKNDKLQGIRTLAKLGHSNFEFWATLFQKSSQCTCSWLEIRN